MSNFKPGDVVTLMSDNYPKTVDVIDGEFIVCVWSNPKDPGGPSHRATFALTSLKLYVKSAPPSFPSAPTRERKFL